MKTQIYAALAVKGLNQVLTKLRSIGEVGELLATYKSVNFWRQVCHELIEEVWCDCKMRTVDE